MLIPKNKIKEDTVQSKAPVKEDIINDVQAFGKKIYMDSCVNCHGSFEGRDGANQFFIGLQQRWQEKEKLILFIKDSKEYFKSNSYEPLSSSKNISESHSFKNLRDMEVETVLEYIKYKIEHGRQ